MITSPGIQVRLIFFFLLILSVEACQSPKAEQSLASPNNPNIVFILADDMGYGDPEVYNDSSKVPTPNINQLAAAGMRFTDAHTPSSVCTPTRYGLLTGRYAWRSALKSSVLWAWDKPLIEPDRVTMPKMLKQKGYTTACIGKWHLGWRWPAKTTGYANDSIVIGDLRLEGRQDWWQKIDFSKPLGGGPLEAGFDYYFGDDVPNFPPYAFIENNQLQQIPTQQKPDSMFGYPGPMVEGWALQNVMPTITQKAVSYIEEQAKNTQPFFLYFALTAPHTPIAPTDDFKGKSKAGLYGDYVHEVDWTVGQIVNALKQAGVYENTFIVFTSDNGSPQRDGTNMNGEVGSVKKYGHNPSKPWRGMKADIWEGGHRVPFIVSWPGMIPADMVNDQVICLTDLMATTAAMLDISTNKSMAEDSYDFSDFLLDKEVNSPVREAIVHHAIDGTFAIRKGNWKLILGKDSGGFSRNISSENKPVETAGQLYQLNEDPAEQNNLYAQHPEIVEELTALLHQYQSEGYSNEQAMHIESN